MNHTNCITIRPAVDTDMAVIYRFIQELEETSFSTAVFETYYLTNISNPDNVYLVAVDENNMLIGYLSCHGQILLHHCGWVFEIQEMYIQAEARGKGIGKMLVTELKNKLSARNYISLEVTANINRTATHAFYVSCGFTETHKKFTKNTLPD